MKSIIILCVVIIAVAVLAAFVYGFVYGIVKRGSKLKQAEETLYAIRREVNLYSELDHVLASAINVHLNKEGK